MILSEIFYDWNDSKKVLDEIETLRLRSGDKSFYDNAFKNAREAWVLAKFCALHYPQNNCEIKLLKDNFPDAAVKIIYPNKQRELEVEITQAFKGGVRDVKNEATNFISEERLEKELVTGITQAIENKIEKNYAADIHLLVYVTNIPTFGEFVTILNNNREKFSAYDGKFRSVNVLATRADSGVEILPEFKVFTTD